MADQKISALGSATTPLAGTEVTVLVQGGADVKITMTTLAAQIKLLAKLPRVLSVDTSSRALGANINLTIPAGTLLADGDSVDFEIVYVGGGAPSPHGVGFIFAGVILGSRSLDGTGAFCHNGTITRISATTGMLSFGIADVPDAGIATLQDEVPIGGGGDQTCRTLPINWAIANSFVIQDVDADGTVSVNYTRLIYSPAP